MFCLVALYVCVKDKVRNIVIHIIRSVIFVSVYFSCFMLKSSALYKVSSKYLFCFNYNMKVVGHAQARPSSAQAPLAHTGALNTSRGGQGSPRLARAPRQGEASPLTTLINIKFCQTLSLHLHFLSDRFVTALESHIQLIIFNKYYLYLFWLHEISDHPSLKR